MTSPTVLIRSGYNVYRDVPDGYTYTEYRKNHETVGIAWKDPDAAERFMTVLAADPAVSERTIIFA